MIRCGAFCLCVDAETGEAASRSALEIERRGVHLRVRKGIPVREKGGGQLISLDFHGDDLPAVHGWLPNRAGEGEYSMLAQTERGLEASRDHCGTRPLYVARSRRWVASDHRFFRNEPMDLLPPRARLEVSEGRVSIPPEGQERFSGTFEEAAAKLASLVSDSVKKRVEGKRLVAVAFSGGLDSSLLAHCAAKHTKVVACSVAAAGSLDSGAAPAAADEMDVESVCNRIDREGAKRELRALDLPFDPSPMDRSLWCIYSVAGRLAADRGAEVILLGQLADELFGGYAKYQASLEKEGEGKAERMMAADVAQCGLRGFIRDEAASSRWCEPRFPFAERELAGFGESLPVSFKVRRGVRKAVLREAALLLGLPEEIAEKQKKAAQYSSGILKLL